MKRHSSRFRAAILLAAGCLPFVTSGCGDDGADSNPGGAGQAKSGSSNGGSGAAQTNGGKGGNATAGWSSGGTKAYAGSTGEGGDGGEGGEHVEPNAGRSGGGASGTGGAGGAAGIGGKGGAGGVSANAGTSGGGAGGMSGGSAGGMNGGGGAGGSGGTGVGASCGNGVVNDGEVCDPVGGPYTSDDCGSDCQMITAVACATCESQTECGALASSSLLSGVATEGPAAGVKRAVLYNRTLDCVRDTKCAEGLPIDCYCGTVSGAQCDAGQGNGKCKTIIEQGLETTVPADVQARYLSAQYGAGLALARVNCDQQNCLEACFSAPP